MKTISGGSSELLARSGVVNDGGRPSKKPITDTRDLELHSSAHAVLSDDDLLTEILFRSSAISVLLFKYVSKRWLSLIKSPTFALRRSQIPNLDPPSALFLRRDTKSSLEYDFVPLDTRIPAGRPPPMINSSFGYGAGNVEILQSCNGLLLCCIRTDTGNMICVCNPSLNLFKMLPKEHIGGIGGFKMAFDPTKSPHYKIIHAAVIKNNGSSYIQILTYSSETCNWNACGDRFPPGFFTGFSAGIYWNNAIYWLYSWDHVTHFSLNAKDPFLPSIKIPKTGNAHCDHKLFESRGCLLLVCKAFNPYQPLTIYEMSNEYPEMFVKYSVNLDDIMMIMSTKWLFFCVWSVVLGEREDESFLVMEINGKIFKYNIVLKTLSNIFDLGSIRINVMPTPSSFDGLPFFASFAEV